MSRVRPAGLSAHHGSSVPSTRQLLCDCFVLEATAAVRPEVSREDAGPDWVFPCEQGGPAGRADGGSGVELGEPGSSPGQAVNVGSVEGGVAGVAEVSCSIPRLELQDLTSS